MMDEYRRVPALGRDVRIGDLYDSLSDTISGDNIFRFTVDRLNPNTQGETYHFARATVIESELPRDSFDLLGVDHDLRLSLLSGLILDKQYETFLTQTDSANGKFNKSLLHTYIKNSKEIVMFENMSCLQKANMPLNSLEKSPATHLVWGIIYGFHTFVSFRSHDSEGRDPLEQRSYLTKQVEILYDSLLPNGNLPKAFKSSSDKVMDITIQGTLFPENIQVPGFAQAHDYLRSIPGRARKHTPIPLELILVEKNAFLKGFDVSCSCIIEEKRLSCDALPVDVAKLYVEMQQSANSLKEFADVINNNCLSCLKSTDISMIERYRLSFRKAIQLFKKDLKTMVSHIRKNESSVSKLHEYLEEFQASEYSPSAVSNFIQTHECLKEKVLWYKKLKKLGVNNPKKSNFHKGELFIFYFNDFCTSSKNQLWRKNYDFFMQLIQAKSRSSDARFHMYESDENIADKNITTIKHHINETLKSQDMLQEYDTRAYLIEDSGRFGGKRRGSVLSYCDLSSKIKVAKRRVPALGRVAKLGDLYDYGLDTLGGENFYGHSSLAVLERCVEKLDHRHAVQVSSSVEAMHALGTDLNLQLNLLSGALSIEKGYEELFRMGNDSIKLIYSYEVQASFIESSTLRKLARGIFGPYFGKCMTNASHFIGGIIWGFQTIVEFKEENGGHGMSSSEYRSYLSSNAGRMAELLQGSDNALSKKIDPDICAFVSGSLFSDLTTELSLDRVFKELRDIPKTAAKLGKEIEPLGYLLYEVNDFAFSNRDNCLDYEAIEGRLENEFRELNIDHLYSEMRLFEYKLDSFKTKLEKSTSLMVFTAKEGSEILKYAERFKKEMDVFRNDLHKSVSNVRLPLTAHVLPKPAAIISNYLNSEYSPRGLETFLTMPQPILEKIDWFQKMAELGVCAMGIDATNNHEFFVFHFNEYTTSKDTPSFKENYKVFLKLITSKSKDSNVKFYISEYIDNGSKFIDVTSIHHYLNGKRYPIQVHINPEALDRPFDVKISSEQQENFTMPTVENKSEEAPNGVSSSTGEENHQSWSVNGSLSTPLSELENDHSSTKQTGLHNGNSTREQNVDQNTNSVPKGKQKVERSPTSSEQVNLPGIQPIPTERNDFPEREPESSLKEVPGHTAEENDSYPTFNHESSIKLMKNQPPSQAQHTSSNSDGNINNGNSNHRDLMSTYEEDIFKRTENEINLILLGETGVGKSTFINSFANYLTFDTMAEAEQGNLVSLIHSQFTVCDDELREEVLEFGQRDSNENIQSGSSRTQSCKSYVFPWKNKRVRIIDTPGINDTRGRDQDSKNMIALVNFVSNFSKIHGICFLLHPNNSRSTATFSSGIYELFRHLHKSASNNLTFIFTNSRGTSFKPGDTFPVLKLFLETLSAGDPEVNIELTTDRYYCMDNEAFRFLVLLKNGKAFDEYDRRSFERSWRISREESIRLVETIFALEPHFVKSSVIVSQVTKLGQIFGKALAEATFELQKQIINCQQERKNGRTGRKSGHSTSPNEPSTRYGVTCQKLTPKELLSRLQLEQNYITATRLEFSMCLLSNGITSHFDYTNQDLMNLVTRERHKQSLVQEKERDLLIENVLEVQKNYENLLVEMKNNHNINQNKSCLTIANLEQIVMHLYSLTFTGNLIRTATEEEYNTVKIEMGAINDIEYTPAE